MKNTLFEKPVTVLVGLGYPSKIESVIEAYQLLSDMRVTASKAAHAAAVKACKAAIAGEIDPEVARSIFVAFARRSAILVSDDPRQDRHRAGLADIDTTLGRNRFCLGAASETLKQVSA